MKKRGQIWGMDMMIGFIIFIMAIIIFFIYSINYSGEAEEIFKKIIYDAEIISKNILSEGHPNDWTEDNAVNIGIMSNNKINKTKLERFYNLAYNNYTKTKNLFNTKYDYYFFLEENMTINSLEVEGIGEQCTNKDNINSSNLVKLTRFTIYKEKPITAYIYVWEE